MNTTIEELHRLEAAATPGPWYADGKMVSIAYATSICAMIDYSEWGNEREAANSNANAALIVAMRNALPELLKALEWPVGWTYELAKLINEDGTYTGWGKPQISSSLPRVPVGSIRNIHPLFALPPHGGVDVD